MRIREKHLFHNDISPILKSYSPMKVFILLKKNNNCIIDQKD